MKRTAAAIVVALLAVACGDSTAPQDLFAAIYVLQTVDGVPLPTAITGNPTFPDYKVVADTLLMTPSGHFDDEPIPESGQRIGLQGTWGFRGDSAFLFESVLGAPAARIHVAGNAMTMRTQAGHIFPDHDLSYIKLP